MRLQRHKTFLVRSLQYTAFTESSLSGPIATRNVIDKQSDDLWKHRSTFDSLLNVHLGMLSLRKSCYRTAKLTRTKNYRQSLQLSNTTVGAIWHLIEMELLHSHIADTHTGQVLELLPNVRQSKGSVRPASYCVHGFTKVLRWLRLKLCRTKHTGRRN